MALLNPGGAIAQFKRNDCSIPPVEVIWRGGVRKYQCSEEAADRYFREAKCLHSRKSLYTDEEGDDGGDVMEEVADEEDSDMLEIFWNGIYANAVRKAFDRL